MVATSHYDKDKMEPAVAEKFKLQLEQRIENIQNVIDKHLACLLKAAYKKKSANTVPDKIVINTSPYGKYSYS